MRWQLDPIFTTYVEAHRDEFARALWNVYLLDPVGMLVERACHAELATLEMLCRIVPDINLGNENGRTLAHSIASVVCGPDIEEDDCKALWLFALKNLDVQRPSIDAEALSAAQIAMSSEAPASIAGMTRSWLAREAAEATLAAIGDGFRP